MTEHLLDVVRDAHNNIEIKETFFQDGVGGRNLAIVEAVDGGASLDEIAAVCNLTRDQVRRIIDDHAQSPEAALCQ